MFPQVRWRSWKHSGWQAYATTRRMKLWAVSWMLTTWQVSSTCWLQQWLSVWLSSSGSTYSTGGCATVSLAYVLASLDCCSPSAGYVPTFSVLIKLSHSTVIRSLWICSVRHKCTKVCPLPHDNHVCYGVFYEYSTFLLQSFRCYLESNYWTARVHFKQTITCLHLFATYLKTPRRHKKVSVIRQGTDVHVINTVGSRIIGTPEK